MNLQNALIELINTDDGYTDKQDILVKNIYRLATESEKEIIDSIFISICGNSLETIIESIQQSKNLDVEIQR